MLISCTNEKITIACRAGSLLPGGDVNVAQVRDAGFLSGGGGGGCVDPHTL
jgi:hypothetical protein